MKPPAVPSDTAALSGPLVGLRILDMSTVVAGPFAATLLADLGADVIKVELPGKGDPLRELAPHKNGVPLWWKVTNRNRKASRSIYASPTVWRCSRGCWPTATS